MRPRRSPLRLLFGLVVLCWSLVPIYWALNVSLTTPVGLESATASFVPNPFTLSQYTQLLKPGSATSTAFYLAFRNSVIASFTGQPGSSPSQSTPVSVTITQVPTTLTLSPNPGTAGLGSPVTLTTLVQYVAGTSLHPSGTITIKDGSTTLTTLSLEDGSASFTITSLAAGTHSLTATYSGDANFVKSAGSAMVTITNP